MHLNDKHTTVSGKMKKCNTNLPQKVCLRYEEKGKFPHTNFECFLVIFFQSETCLARALANMLSGLVTIKIAGRLFPSFCGGLQPAAASFGQFGNFMRATHTNNPPIYIEIS